MGVTYIDFHEEVTLEPYKPCRGVQQEIRIRAPGVALDLLPLGVRRAA